MPASPLHAGEVIWVEQFDTPEGEEFQTLLEVNGHTVTKLFVDSNTLILPDDIDMMSAADLVILGRKVGSGSYNTFDWNDVTAPMLVMTPYVLRISRWGADLRYLPWFFSDGLRDETPVSIVVEDAAHPIFEGMTVTDDPDLGLPVTGPWHTAVDRGTTLATDLVDAGGTLIASSEQFGVVAAQWDAGAVAAGPRLFLAMGSREADGSGVETAGKFNITPLGEQALLNAVAIFSEPAEVIDRDGDGVPDEFDAFPDDSAEWADTDGDGTGDNADTDDDNDDVPDTEDAFPLDPNESADSDGDGIGDNSDPDSDNDGIANAEDKFPTDPTEWDDTDNDGTGDNSDPDADGDGNPDPRTSNIVWVVNDDTSDVGVEFIELLNANGHTATEWFGDSQTLTDFPEDFARVLNVADLVVVSRKISSGDMNTDIWDRVTAPMLVLTPYVLRNNRWQWFGDDALGTDTPLSIIAEVPEHPLFEDIPLVAGQSGPWHEPVDRGTNFMNSEVINGGTLLASTDLFYVVAAEWPAGTVAAGPRMFLALGSQEPSGTTIAEAGKWESTTELGRQALLNAVGYFTPPLDQTPGGGGDPSFRITAFTYSPGTTEVTVTWPSEPAVTYTLQRSTDGMTSWTDVPGGTVTATGATTSATDSPAPAPPAYYRVVRVE